MIFICKGRKSVHSNKRFSENRVFIIFIRICRAADSHSYIICLFNNLFNDFIFLSGEAVERVDIYTFVSEKFMCAEYLIEPFHVIAGIGICFINEQVISRINQSTFFKFLFQVFVRELFGSLKKLFRGYCTELVFIDGIEHEFGKISFLSFFGIHIEFIGNFFGSNAH